MKLVGMYDAKRDLAKLLREVEAGEEITITRHGRPVARLVAANKPAHERFEPFGEPVPREERNAAIDRMFEIRERTNLDGITIRELIDEGRRY